jgi:hypothetical protein
VGDPDLLGNVVHRGGATRMASSGRSADRVWRSPHRAFAPLVGAALHRRYTVTPTLPGALIRCADNPISSVHGRPRARPGVALRSGGRHIGAGRHPYRGGRPAAGDGSSGRRHAVHGALDTPTARRAGSAQAPVTKSFRRTPLVVAAGERPTRYREVTPPRPGAPASP